MTDETGAITTMVYTADGMHQSRTGSGDSVIYVRDGANVLYEADDLGADAYYTHLTEGWGSLLSRTDDAGSSYYGFDPSGNTRILVPDDGGAPDRYAFNAFGVENVPFR